MLLGYNWKNYSQQDTYPVCMILLCRGDISEHAPRDSESMLTLSLF